jgi:hypothetical protein
MQGSVLALSRKLRRACHGPAAQGEAGVVAFVSAAPPEEASAGVV